MTEVRSKKAESPPQTKRAKRKQPNNKNKWVANAPRIQSAEARAANYLRVAGLHPNRKVDQQKIVLDPNSPIQKFGRLLGGTDQRVRHQAVLQLRAYLKQRCGEGENSPGLSQLDLLKLWKCLWYTLYMADQVAVQQELSNHLSKLIWCVAGTEEEDEYAAQIYLEMCMQQEAMMADVDDLEGDEDEDADDVSDEEVVMQEVFNSIEAESNNDEEDEEEDEVEDESASASGDEDEGESNPEESDVDEEDETCLEDIPHKRGAHLAHLFLKCLLMTIQREWGNMDKYRIDKFYTFLRMVLRQVYEYMAKRHWNLGIIRLFNDAIIDEVLSQTPNGVRLHFIDICVDELAAVSSEAPMPLTEATFLDVLEPFFSMAQTGAGGGNMIHQRAVENVLIKFLEKYSFVAEKEDESVPIFDQVHVGTVSQFIFELASEGSINNMYRRALYDVHKKYEKRLKQVGRDVQLQADDREVDKLVDDEIEQQDVEDGKKIDSSCELEEESDKTKRTKKKRKKNLSEQGCVDKDEKPAVEVVQPVETLNVEGTETQENRKKKKKKKRKSSEADSEVNASGRENAEEDEITISVEAQHAAKKKLSDEKKKKQVEESKEKNGKTSSDAKDSGKRRVKFGALNRARSWTASMRGLRNNEPQAHKVATPEKGILLNKHTPIPVVKGKRKSAVDYF